jgi:hypothetical protein
MQMLYSDWLYATRYLIVNEIARAQTISLLRQISIDHMQW